MKELSFIKDLELTPIHNFWDIKEDAIPKEAGVYILLAKPGIKFLYPKGKSSVFYIGQASNLRKRLLEHKTFSLQAKNERKRALFWPRYEYAAKFGGRYAFVRTWKGLTARNLEDFILCRFAKQYRSFPVANSAGSWNRIESEKC